MDNEATAPKKCECDQPCCCCDEFGQDQAPHKLGEHFPAGCPHGDEMQKLLEEVEKYVGTMDDAGYEMVWSLKFREAIMLVSHIRTLEREHAAIKKGLGQLSTSHQIYKCCPNELEFIDELLSSITL